MSPRTRPAFTSLTLVAVLAAGCASAAPPPVAATTVDGGGTVVTVHRTESCACCGEYEAHLEANGFEVAITTHDDATALQDQLGVPTTSRSCHVNEVDGYLAVGHVPAQALVDLLDAQPTVTGIALGGMPLGAPGMPGEPEGPFVVTTFDDGQDTGVFGTYGG